MRITVEIDDELLQRAKRHAQQTGRILPAIVEDGLSRVLPGELLTKAYELPDLSVGDPKGRYPLATYSWEDIRELIYGEGYSRE